MSVNVSACYWSSRTLLADALRFRVVLSVLFRKILTGFLSLTHIYKSFTEFDH
jgi:hypothetical protein